MNETNHRPFQPGSTRIDGGEILVVLFLAVALIAYLADVFAGGL